ncbi:UNVERIFIED_CONTAM: SAM domain and HD [Siphonaria sp. JEL0065]|nr:SAM domain and HD [Siphonaria sp. JEL0065]
MCEHEHRFDKVVTDPIHGQMHIEDYAWAVIDTPQFQRLRDLKQLGSAYFVFPGAAHNRFEHSLGVSHLSHELMLHLKVEQPDLDIDHFDIKNVVLAGLTHDLGHGPFSHIFDSHVIPRLRPDRQWSHEDASESMLEHLVNSNGLTEDQCSETDLKFIKALIRGGHSNDASSSRGSHKQFLFDVVNNKRNSVDVDKFDYLARDSYHCGVKSGFDHQRSMKFTRVIGEQICWNKNEALNLCLMFQTRFNLFKQVYTHKVGKSIELMLIEALCLADPYLNIASAIDSPEEYTYLTDAVLKEIERSRAVELQASRDILKRIRNRDLYRCAETYLLPGAFASRVTKANFTAERLLRYAEASERRLVKPDDIFAEYLVLDWCFKTENPIDKCRFFNKFNKDKLFDLPKSQLSHLIPTNPQEITLRVFVKHDSIRVLVQKIFRLFIQNLDKEYPSTSMSFADTLMMASGGDAMGTAYNGNVVVDEDGFGFTFSSSLTSRGRGGTTPFGALDDEEEDEKQEGADGGVGVSSRTVVDDGVSAGGIHRTPISLVKSGSNLSNLSSCDGFEDQEEGDGGSGAVAVANVESSVFRTPLRPVGDSVKRTRRMGSAGSSLGGGSPDFFTKKIRMLDGSDGELEGFSPSGSMSDGVSRANDLPPDYSDSWRNSSPQRKRKK